MRFTTAFVWSSAFTRFGQQPSQKPPEGGTPNHRANANKKFTCRRGRVDNNSTMFSHIVVFWTDPANPDAAEEFLAGANELLKNIPGLVQFHAGKMAPSHRPVVEQSYQVALNLIFPNKKAQDDYQAHPRHIEFVDKYVRRLVKKVVVYDFE
jgi:hypothetical protein